MVNDEELIKKILQKNPKGLTYMSLSKETNLSRDKVRIALARLDGAGEVEIIEMGVAKLVYLK